MSCSNGIEPLQLPLTNVTVDSNGIAVARGVEFGVGTPQQIMALQITLNDYDMFVSNAAQCNETKAKCAGQMGGMYDSTKSSTYTRVRKSEWNGTTPDYIFSSSNFIFFNEHIEFGANASTNGVPFIMNEPGISHQGGLPLANGSTFLSEAYENEWIPGTAFGLYYGSRSIDAPEDGLLVVGGYDTARIDGNLTDLEFNPECPTCVTVESMVYETSESSESLIDEPTIFGLEAYGISIIVTQDAYDRFQNFTNSTFDTGFQLPILPPDAERGNLTVRLSNGFTTTIPAEELFTYDRNYDDDGRLNVANTDQTVGLIQNVTTGTDLGGILGGPFISMNYLFFDYEREQVKIGKAKKAGSGLEGLVDGTAIEPSIEAVCALNDRSSGGSGSNAGAIAGGVVGGVAGLALILFGIWFFMRRRKRAQAAKATPGDPNSASTAAGAAGLARPSEKADVKDVKSVNSPTSPVEATPTNDPRYTLNEMASPEQMNGTAAWESEKKKGGLGGDGTLEPMPETPLQEMPASTGHGGEKQPPGGQKGPVELP